jgi:hypothetical protein
LSRRLRAILLLVAAAMAIDGCSRSAPIPAGAQQVHVVITESSVRLAPSTVRAGDVYLVLDAPPDGSLFFFSRGGSPVLSPLTQSDLDRLAGGNTQGTEMTGLDAGGCSPAQNAEDRGRLGPCGNVLKVVLEPGRYAVTAEPLEGVGTNSTPLALLEAS